MLRARLVNIAPTTIHKSQAGFIPGRDIANQTKLIETILDYAEVAEKNGLIITLDQEKVYDKITHDYLWRVLQKYRLPDKFINMIKTLHQDAETRVMINGTMSTNYI